jgi:ribokinase
MALIVAGSLNLDLVGRAPRIPAPGETVLGSALQRFHGGKGGNQAVAAARSGASVRFVGSLGDDAAGAELLAGLRAEGIETSAVRRVAEPTGTALITVADSGENAITVLPGANRLAPMPPEEWPAEVGWLLLQLEIPMATCLAWAKAAHAAGAQVMLNAAPAAERSDDLLALVDLLLVNEGEARALADGTVGAVSRGVPDTPLRDVLQALARRGPAIVVATLGARGCLAWQRDTGRWIEQPAFAVDVVDTTGAGDTFAGALAACLDDGAALEQALTFATAAAAMACGVAGARSGMPGRRAVQAFLAQAVAD